MIKLIRFVGLIIQSILIEFLHVFGLVAFLLAAALGYFRAAVLARANRRHCLRNHRRQIH